MNGEEPWMPCWDCGTETSQYEYYMVCDDVWADAAGTELFMRMGVFFCIGCLEKRLGRELGPADFTDCLLNIDRDAFMTSERLLDRFGKAETA